MAKPKFDFDDEQNLIRIEGWARDGLDDKQIAANIGYSEAHFSVLKGKLPKLSKVFGFISSAIMLIVSVINCLRSRNLTDKMIIEIKNEKAD